MSRWVRRGAVSGRRLGVTRACVGRVVVAVGVASGLLVGLPASVATAVTVGTTPVGWTPYLLPSPVNQIVEELEPCRGTMFAVGTMSTVGRGSATFVRSNAFSFSATTGVMRRWAPQVNGPVRSIALSPNCRTAYLGGSFTRVNHRAALHLVAVDAVTGAVKKHFKRQADGPVSTVRYAHGTVIIGGGFTTVNGARRTRIASLNPTTGAATSYLHVKIKGAYQHTSTQVYNSQLSHDHHRLLIEGVFTSIEGHARRQAAVLDLGKSRVRLDRWRSKELLADCRDRFYVRAGTWSPNDNTIYLATTGGRPTSGPGSLVSQPRAGLCDAVAAFPATSTRVHHTWINYSGCDTLLSVAADHRNVYVSGHERWADNPFGCNHSGPGAVSRPGIGSIDPKTGLAKSWNPTRSRGRGSHQLLITKAGLWVASDTWITGTAQDCGGQPQHGGICFLPY
jgi:hypothetical protein